MRRLDGCGLRQQAGRDSVPLPLLVGQTPSEWSENLDLHLNMRYLPGQSCVLADLLSRLDQVIRVAWSLHPQVATTLLLAWGSPSLDLFATHLTAVLPLCCSIVLDHWAFFEEAFSPSLEHPGSVLISTLPLVSWVVARVRETPIFP